MPRQGITKVVCVTALGLLVFIFGLIFLSVLSPTLRPSHTDFVFAIAIGRRTLTVAVVTLSVILVALVFFFARTLRRRNLN
jgi:uncharacterized BrkB/YihY/UPF0761 family membrane protein